MAGALRITTKAVPHEGTAFRKVAQHRVTQRVR